MANPTNHLQVLLLHPKIWGFTNALFTQQAFGDSSPPHKARWLLGFLFVQLVFIAEWMSHFTIIKVEQTDKHHISSVPSFASWRSIGLQKSRRYQVFSILSENIAASIWKEVFEERILETSASTWWFKAKRWRSPKTFERVTFSPPQKGH